MSNYKIYIKKIFENGYISEQWVPFSTLKEAEKAYVGKYFSLPFKDNTHKIVKIELKN